MGEIGKQLGIPAGKKASVRNMALAQAAPNAAKRRRPKPGQEVNSRYSY
jgi:hypothetical protein